MNLTLTNRRENRFYDIHSPEYYGLTSKTNQNSLPESKFNYQNEITNLFEKLFNNESSIESISNSLIILNNSIISSSHLLEPYLTIEIINSIFNLASIKPYICCFVYKFFTYLIQKQSQKFYPYLLKSNIYKYTIDIICPELDHFSYHQILLFICETIQKIPISIYHLIECEIIKHLAVMNPNENIDQLLFIYSNILMANEINDYSSISNIFNYLSNGQITTIVNALYYIQKCLQKHENDHIWKLTIFNQNLFDLMKSFSAYLVSDAISCYSLICSYGDEAISMLLSDNKIFPKIMSFIFNSIPIDSLIPNNRCVIYDNHIAALASLNFLNSMISYTCSEDNVTQFYNIFNEFHFPNTIHAFNFPCKEKICEISLNLLCKINRCQAKSLFNYNFLESIAEILINDSDMIEFLDSSLTISKNRFVLDKEFINVIDDILSKYVLDFEPL